MSGYLEVKYPFKANLGLNPFKSWRRQWCILRPSPTCSGGSLAVYCSEAGAAAGTVELPAGAQVRRAKSRTRPFAFAVFPAAEPRKPLLLLAAHTLQDSQAWMDKIRALLNGNKMLGTETLLKDSYPVTVLSGEVARRWGAGGAAVLSITPAGLRLTPSRAPLVSWRHVTDVQLASDGDNRICVLTIDRSYSLGGGVVRVAALRARELSAAARAAAAAARPPSQPQRTHLSRSDGDLRPRSDSFGEVRRSSWYSGPSDISLDDIDLVMSKECSRIPSGQLSRCSGEGHLAAGDTHATHGSHEPHGSHGPHGHGELDDSMSDRRSLLSEASGIYEEIPELPAHSEGSSPADTVNGQQGDSAPSCLDPPSCLEAAYCPMAGSAGAEGPEPCYESVSELAAARRPRRRPPPLPPRTAFGTSKQNEPWSRDLAPVSSAVGSVGTVGAVASVGSVGCVGCAGAVTRHGSLGALPLCGGAGAGGEGGAGSARTLPSKARQKQPFSVFRKRLKSDSRIATSPKSDTSKENKDMETKKKKFDFTPTRDIFKNFKVSRKMKGLKISAGLSKGEAKSCEFLDETEHVATNRCSKSVECLEDEFLDEYDGNLSIEFNDDAVAALALPQEIVDLILRSREQINKIRLKDQVESDYMPMSPIVAPGDHYIVMSPRTHIA